MEDDHAVTAEQAEQDAKQLLTDLWDEDDGQPLIPVDPIQIAEWLGIDVLTAIMNPDFSGALEKHRYKDPVIYLNREDSKNRQRFTCAHELGHYYRRTKQGDLEYSFTDRRDKLAQAGTDEDEIYANQFAAALIMPAAEVKQWYKDLKQDPVRLANKFRVSEDAMRFRLVNLRLV
jgi:Zn-dependent peptidase ImmA (M78 family)